MFKRIFNYIRPSIEGEDGKLSYRRLSAIVVLMLMTGMTIKGFINQYEIQALYGFIAFFLILTGIITGGQLIALRTGKKDDDENKA